MPFALLSRFDALRKTGDGWTALCPAHGDKARSLSLAVRDGKLLVNCFAGCSFDSILAAKGLTAADLRLDEKPARPGAPVVPLTVARLAAAKGLPVEALTRYGVVAVEDIHPTERLKHGIGGRDGLWVPYRHADGTIGARTRLRTAIRAGDGSSWLKGQGFGAILPYGLQDLADARDQGCLVICEGETDYWTLRHAGIPALGLPGATNVRGSLLREHLAGIQAVYVAQDSDSAGAGFVAGIRAHVASWGLTGVYAVPMPAGCKDVNDLYRRDPAAFVEVFVGLMQAAATAGTVPARTFTTAGDIYTLTVPEYGLRLELDQIRRAWGDLTGELAISRDGTDLSRSNVNLSSDEKRQKFAAGLSRRLGAEIPWPDLIEDYAVRCLKAEREGRPGVWLDEVVAAPSARLVRVLGGMDIPVELPSCLFGDGDTGKSYLALAIIGQLSAAGLVCGIIDAEMEDTIHAGRLRALFGAQLPRVAHLRLDKPLTLQADAVRRFVRDRALSFLVYDSVGFLTPEPEKSESALGYMRATRQIGVGSLSIAHVTKAKDVNPADQKPFGSNFYYQSFRGLWYAQAEAESDSDGRKVIAIHDRKASVKGKQPPFAVALVVRAGFAAVEPATLHDSPELAATLPLGRRIESALTQGAQTPAFLSDLLDASEGSVRKAIDRAVSRGRIVKMPAAVGGKGSLYGLASVA